MFRGFFLLLSNPNILVPFSFRPTVIHEKIKHLAFNLKHLLYCATVRANQDLVSGREADDPLIVVVVVENVDPALLRVRPPATTGVRDADSQVAGVTVRLD